MSSALQAGTLAETSYEASLVLLSYAIAVLGSFVALTAAQHMRRPGGGLNWLNVLSAGAALGGIGVWAMHFTGMLALRLGMGSAYAMAETLVSLVAAVAATSGALAFVALRPDSGARLLGAGTVLGLGVAFMHYLGMFGMRFPGFIQWSAPLVALSVVIAVAAACAALWLAFRTRKLALRGLAALVMGVAVCAMHYTGMAAADFICTAPDALRQATPTGFAVVSAMDLPLLTALVAVGMAALIGYDQLIQRYLVPQAVRT
ncbi:MHYT domain-containing protein [Pulveribacter suum]|uniref:Histidine kinase n=1 Tax=Pulveribacter suum TaxID=2116657 RepID=A0A2P1NPS4_9BURK|nr:MHYT domain-containing protein [Pulveribacter suum]AVP59017.1 histidine kinase [Pulveribacter suum]